MRSLNRRFLGHDYATDVLTFQMGRDCADIIICPHVAAKNAKRHGTSTGDEIILYVIHGLLHLAGYEDHAPKDILKMRQMEVEMLKG